MKVRFWGVRGSVAVSGAQVAWIGGNTPCLEVVHEGHRIILDSGTGVRGLGEALVKEGGPTRAIMLFSHLHWDHLQGFPFFSPAYLPASELMLLGPGGDTDLHRALARQMEPPSFPVTLAAMRARLGFGAARAGVPLEIGPFRVMPFELPHPQGCLGYRLEAGGQSFVYATDVELSSEGLTPEVGCHLEGADALCLDAQYTPAEYLGHGTVPRKGWGHSTMIGAAQIAAAVGARRLFLFHHDPAHNDEQVEAMTREARGHFARCEPAREGLLIDLGPDALDRCA